MNGNWIGFTVAILLVFVTTYSAGAIVPIMNEDDETSEIASTDEQDWWRQLPKKEVRSPRPNGGRPKYDPGLKWIGLGKRYDSAAAAAQLSTIAGPYALHDMKSFFNVFLRQMQQLKNQKIVDRASPMPDNNYMPIPSTGKGNDIRDIRSKGMRTTYDPSLLWTGLGR